MPMPMTNRHRASRNMMALTPDRWRAGRRREKKTAKERTDLVVMVHGRQMPRYATRQGHGLNCLGRVQDRHTRL